MTNVFCQGSPLAWFRCVPVSLAGDDSSHVGVAVGVVMALLIVLGVVAGAVWFLRSRHLLGAKHTGGVAFENPSYLREVNMDHIQVSAC